MIYLYGRKYLKFKYFTSVHQDNSVLAYYQSIHLQNMDNL